MLPSLALSAAPLGRRVSSLGLRDPKCTEANQNSEESCESAQRTADGAVWPELRAVVATTPDPAGWIALSNGFLALRDGRLFAEEYRRLGFDYPANLSPKVRALFESPLATIREARQALHPIAYPDHVRIAPGIGS